MSAQQAINREPARVDLAHVTSRRSDHGAALTDGIPRDAISIDHIEHRGAASLIDLQRLCAHGVIVDAEPTQE